MKPRAVEHYAAPGYPTRLQVLASPRWMHDNLPPSWRANLEMAGAIALFVAMGTSACEQRPASSPSGSSNPAPPSQVIQVASVPPTTSGVAGLAPEAHLPASAVVAPIFEHGEGRGATGCVVVAPPVFLSEEEAMQIIREELARHRVSLAQDKFAVESNNAHTKPVQIDAADRARGIAVEFVSSDDALAMQGSSMSSVQGYDTKGAAKKLASSVSEKGKSKMYFGFLYDPIAHVDFRDPSAQNRSWEESSREAKEQSRKMLREQVQDFVQWLRSQGAM